MGIIIRAERQRCTLGIRCPLQPGPLFSEFLLFLVLRFQFLVLGRVTFPLL